MGAMPDGRSAAEYTVGGTSAARADAACARRRRERRRAAGAGGEPAPAAGVSPRRRDGILRRHALAHSHARRRTSSFFSNLFNNVETAFRHYGYLIIFLPILGESAGIPLPGETVLLAGGLAASKGILSLPLVILVGASAAIIGDNLGYLVGRRGGRPLLFRYGAVLHVKDRQIAILDSFFDKHGPKTVFFGRWVIFLRVWAALFAGASRMHWRQFVFWNALGGLAWATTMSCAGLRRSPPAWLASARSSACSPGCSPSPSASPWRSSSTACRSGPRTARRSRPPRSASAGSASSTRSAGRRARPSSSRSRTCAALRAGRAAGVALPFPRPHAPPPPLSRPVRVRPSRGRRAPAPSAP